VLRSGRSIPEHLRKHLLFGIVPGYSIGVFLLVSGIGIHSGFEEAFGVIFLLLSSLSLWTNRVRTRSTGSN
jgi:hypothetical protein